MDDKIHCHPNEDVIAKYGHARKEGEAMVGRPVSTKPVRDQMPAFQQGTVRAVTVPNDVEPVECKHPNTTETIIMATAKGLTEEQVRKLRSD